MFTGEQLCLCGKVFLHGAVVVQVILCQIGEYGNIKDSRSYAVLRQRKGGHLHDTVGAALRRHSPEEGVKLLYPRSGGGVFIMFHGEHINEHLCGADKPRLYAVLVEYVMHQSRRGGLAVGAGYAYKAQLLLRLPRHYRTQPAVKFPCVGDDYLMLPQP